MIRRPRRSHRAPARGRRASLALAVAVALATGTVGAAESIAGPPTLGHAAYSTGATGAWYNDTTLGRTAGTDQFAQARVTGLTTGSQQAGFLMRYASRTSRIRVTVSGAGWRIEPTGGAALTGTFAHGPDGLLRVEVVGRTVRVRWNGTLVAERAVGGDYPGRHVVATVRQARKGVTLRSLTAGTPAAQPTRTTTPPKTTPPKTTTTAPDATTPGTGPVVAGRAWWSGASGDQAADGSYGTWRGTALGIGGTWTDTASAQLDQWTLCAGPFSRWTRPLDVAVGGIYRSKGDTWAAAARGAYDARWTTMLTRIRTCWGTRDTGLLYLRFAHEMNLPNDWAVRGGEEASFVAAMTRFSTLRYRIVPKAKIVFCPNDGTDGGLKLDARKLWPGKDAQGRPVADVYAVDSYNEWPFVTTVDAFTKKINGVHPNGAPLGIEKHRQYAEKLGVPFAIGEWSTEGQVGSAGGGGESPVYVQQFNAWARAHARDVTHPAPGQLLYEIHFNLWRQYQYWPGTIQPKTAGAYRVLPWGR
jgi:hypothetical protein